MDTPQCEKGLYQGFNPIPRPPGQGVLNRVRHASTASPVGCGENFIKQDLEGPWPHLLLELWSIIFRAEFIKQKLKCTLQIFNLVNS
jgi:hypothetical protein